MVAGAVGWRFLVVGSRERDWAVCTPSVPTPGLISLPPFFSSASLPLPGPLLTQDDFHFLVGGVQTRGMIQFPPGGGDFPKTCQGVLLWLLSFRPNHESQLTSSSCLRCCCICWCSSSKDTHTHISFLCTQIIVIYHHFCSQNCYSHNASPRLSPAVPVTPRNKTKKTSNRCVYGKEKTNGYQLNTNKPKRLWPM